MKKILVIGGGFAGVWSAVGAARAAREFQASDIEITLVTRDPYLTIRPRLHEEDLSRARVPLSRVLEPVGVRIVQGLVTGVETAAEMVTRMGRRAAEGRWGERRSGGSGRPGSGRRGHGPARQVSPEASDARRRSSCKSIPTNWPRSLPCRKKNALTTVVRAF